MSKLTKTDPIDYFDLLIRPFNALLEDLKKSKVEIIPDSLNDTQLMIIFRIDREFGSSQSQLANQLGITKQSIGVSINLLIKKKLVIKIKDPTDGRASLIRLTEKAWQLIDQSRKHLRITLDRWKNKLGSKNYKKLDILLVELNQLIKQENITN